MLGALAVAAALAASPPRYTTRECQREEGGRSSRGIPCGGREAETYLEFIPSSGAGLPVAENLCDALAAEVPNWATPVDGGAGNWCLGGDGQEVYDSQVDFEPFGSPEAVSVTVCPSGPDCTEKGALGLAASGSAAAAALDTGTGPITACWFGSVDTAGTGALLTAATGGSTAQISWYIEQGAGSMTFYVSSGSVLRSPTMTTPAQNTINIICLSHGGAASTVKPYINGTAGTPSATVDRQSISVKPALSGINGTTTYAPVSAVALGAFYVDQELSAATIAAIARRVLADQPKALVRGSPSLALTYTRTGSMFCSKADNTGSILPANRPCISQNGILVEAAATNYVVRSQEFDNASWLKNGSPVTANYAIAPDGTKTAERFTVTAGGNQFAYGSVTGPAGANTFSVFVQSISGALTFPVCAYTGAAYTCNSCAISTSAVTRCSVTVTATTDWRYLIGDYYVDNLARDVIVWGAQSEAGSVATAYTPTTSASAARGAALASVAFTPSSVATGSMSVSVTIDEIAVNSGYFSAEASTTFKQSLIQFSGLKGYVGGSNTASGTLGAVGTKRLVLYWDGSQSVVGVNGTFGTPGAAGTPAATDTLRLGNYSNSQVQTGRFASFCYDTRPSRCR